MKQSDELAIAVQATKKAGKIIKDGYHKLHSVSRKRDKNFVRDLSDLVGRTVRCWKS